VTTRISTADRVEGDHEKDPSAATDAAERRTRAIEIAPRVFGVDLAGRLKFQLRSNINECYTEARS
jgi:hypothetical protein